MDLVYHTKTGNTDLLNLTPDEYAVIRMGLIGLFEASNGKDVKETSMNLFDAIGAAHEKAKIVED